MDVSEAFNCRRSVRSFTGEEPAESALKAILGSFNVYVTANNVGKFCSRCR